MKEKIKMPTMNNKVDTAKQEAENTVEKEVTTQKRDYEAEITSLSSANASLREEVIKLCNKNQALEMRFTRLIAMYDNLVQLYLEGK